ncbi:hypothetical protein [Corynebacterium crudilactis]|uniref:Uncharacterized protein n=1 Tax=Corynebacterium crudilactis TaxID=1652495 RepID=A0A172QRF5_9CORY|nr:hypothetical protein [Corynebacterium crudilactis]ANE03275.1 hypothetical protein ccrud_02970 [Corynebacterium crudilactis]
MNDQPVDDLDFEKVVFRMSQYLEDLIPSENSFGYGDMYDKTYWPTLTTTAAWLQEDLILIVFRVEVREKSTFMAYFSQIFPRYNPASIEFGAVELMYAGSIAGDHFISKIDLDAPHTIHWGSTFHDVRTPNNLEELLDYSKEISMWLHPDINAWLQP